MRNLIQCVARSICYSRASHATRKDIFPATGIFDAQLSLVGRTKCKGILENNIELSSFRDSSITGCTITNDRRFRAGFAGNNLCRFCHGSIESLHHVIHDCPKLPCRDIQPRMPLDCGPNFPLLGIVEVPEYIVANKLRASSTAHIPVAEWCQSPSDHLTCLWTDGSCDFPEFFWVCKGDFSITDINGVCIHSGSVQHPALCSYTTELWALIYAFCCHSNPVEIATDCDAIVQQTKQLICTLKVPHTWQHFEWWSFLLTIYCSRLQFAAEPLNVRWVPSHLLEHLPIHLISDAAAREAGSCWLDIRCNRQADYHAKRAVQRNNLCAEFTKDKVMQIAAWQKWLAHVSSAISSLCNDDEPIIHNFQEVVEAHNTQTEVVLPHQSTLAHEISAYKNFLPKWNWDLTPEECLWCTDFTNQNKPKNMPILLKTIGKQSCLFLRVSNGRSTNLN